MGVFGGEGVATVLHAEHQKGFGPVVAHAALPFRSHAHHAAFLYWEHLAVDLELTLAAEEEVEFLVVFVRMEEAGLLSGGEHLEGEVAAGGANGLSAEHLAGNLDIRSEFKHIVLDVGKTAEISGAEVSAILDSLNLFHLRFLLSFTAAKLQHKITYVKKLPPVLLLTYG